MKTTITTDEYHMLLGLWTVARDHNRREREAVDAMRRVLGANPDPPGIDRFGHIEDSIWGRDDTLGDALRRAGVIVKDVDGPDPGDGEDEDVVARFWDELGEDDQQQFFTDPTYTGVWIVRSRSGFTFDNAFWPVFNRYPFEIYDVGGDTLKFRVVR